MAFAGVHYYTIVQNADIKGVLLVTFSTLVIFSKVFRAHDVILPTMQCCQRYTTSHL